MAPMEEGPMPMAPEAPVSQFDDDDEEEEEEEERHRPLPVLIFQADDAVFFMHPQGDAQMVKPEGGSMVYQVGDVSPRIKSTVVAPKSEHKVHAPQSRTNIDASSDRRMTNAPSTVNRIDRGGSRNREDDMGDAIAQQMQDAFADEFQSTNRGRGGLRRTTTPRRDWEAPPFVQFDAPVPDESYALPAWYGTVARGYRSRAPSASSLRGAAQGRYAAAQSGRSRYATRQRWF
eukprot:Polyplicarium_translucidae@DN4652_c0_g1_i2.p1